MKKIDELKLDEEVWIIFNFLHFDKKKTISIDTIEYLGINKPIRVKVDKINKTLGLGTNDVTLIPIDKNFNIGRITIFMGEDKSFYESYEEALTGLVTEMKTNIEILKTITSNLESNIVELLNENNR